MAVGEYVSVSAQRDSEQADIELKELAMIYVNRWLEKELAMKVAQQLSARDRLGAHMRDELGSKRGRSRDRCKRRGFRLPASHLSRPSL